MPGRDRVAALRRARERQHLIEQAATRAVKAQTAVKRAQQARQAALQKADARVREAQQTWAEEIAGLAAVAGSPVIAADILGISQREAQRASSEARRSQRHDSAA